MYNDFGDKTHLNYFFFVAKSTLLEMSGKFR